MSYTVVLNSKERTNLSDPINNAIYNFDWSNLEQGEYKVTWNYESKSHDIDLTGCLLWLDGKDPLYTGVTPINNSYLSEWRDKSGLGNNARSNIPISYDNGFNFTEKEYLDGICIYNTNKLTVMAVSKVSSLSSTRSPARVISLGIAGINDYNNSDYMYLGRYQSSFGLVAWRNYNFKYNEPPTIDETYLFETFYDGIKNFTTVQQGDSSYFSAYDSIDNFNIKNFTIGTNTNHNDLNALFYGCISEIIVFKDVLSKTKRQEIEGYLSWKWGINSKLPSNHPYYNIAPASYTPPKN